MHKYLIIGLIIIILIIIYFIIKNNNGEKYDEDKDIVNEKYNYEIINNNPKIRLLDNFVTKDEAEHMIKLANQFKKQSELDSILKINLKIRSSKSAFIPKSYDEIVERIEKRVIDYLQINPERLEPLQIVIYDKGQEYKPHYDWFMKWSKEAYRGGNRTDTMLIYLNTLEKEDGGNTVFPKLNLKFRPIQGNTIHFKNMKNGKTLDDTLHGGEKILTDKTKYAINVWIRQGKFV